MLSAQEAEAKILQLVQPLDPKRDREQVSLSEAHERILATEISSPLDYPYWDNSAMDGYAVRAGDLQTCTAEAPIALKVVMEIPAGRKPEGMLQSGQAARIFTGSMVPEGANAVVMQEKTQRQGDRVTLTECPQVGAWIRKQGAYYRAGTPLLKSGIKLNGPDIAVLATAQCVEVSVYRRPRVCLLSTGSELVSPEQPLNPGQIVDSNQPLLTVLVEQAGAIAQPLGIIPDDRATLKAAIANALKSADAIVSSGGVSVGDYDYVEEILVELGGTLHIQSVAIKPGKPLTVATLPNPGGGRPVLYFGLPGNPVSTPVGFWRFVDPALRKLSGASQSWGPTFLRANAKQDLKSDGRRETYLWGQLSLSSEGIHEFDLAGGTQNSGNLINLAQTNALAVLRCDRSYVSADDWVTVMQVGPVQPAARQ
jgi:molybdopterin molybdotransferase